MAETEIVGRVLSYPTIYGDAVWEGSDAPIQLRVASRRTTAGGSPDPYLRSEVDQIFYSVARKTNEVYEYVADYVDLEIADTDAIPADVDNPEDWDFDEVGFNFSHTVPHAALDGPALHLILYTFVLSDGTQIVQPVEIMVNAPCGMEAEDGGGSPGGGGATPSATTLIFSQTQTVTVHTQSAATSLVGTGEGACLIPADSQSVGDEYTYEAAGFYSTLTGVPGGAAWIFKIASDLTLTFPTVQFLGTRSNARWNMRVRVVRRTIGGSGTVTAEGQLIVEGGASPQLCLVGTTTPVTVATDVSKIPDIQIDWETSNVANSMSMQDFTIKKAGVSE